MSDGSMTVAEAGRRGGTRCRDTHGPDYYATIGALAPKRDRAYFVEMGKKGAAAQRARLGPAGVSDLARKGGERTKLLHGSSYFADIARRGAQLRREAAG